MPPDDAAYLWDMREAAVELLTLFAEIDRATFERNRVLRLAAERLLTNIGEAARLVSEDFRLEHPEIPWRTIIAQRNILVHEYGSVRPDLIWSVLRADVPLLLRQLDAIVPRADVDDEAEAT